MIALLLPAKHQPLLAYYLVCQISILVCPNKYYIKKKCSMLEDGLIHPAGFRIIMHATVFFLAFVSHNPQHVARTYITV